MNGPDGKPVHAELTMRGTALMLGPEMPEMGARSAKNAGASPTTLYLLVEKVDKVFARALTRHSRNQTGLRSPILSKCLVKPAWIRAKPYSPRLSCHKKHQSESIGTE